MVIASQHARERRHPAAEAALWLLWLAARLTGLAVLARRVARLARDVADSDASHWVQATYIDFTDAAGRAVRRAMIRAELAVAELLAGPVPDLLGVATARLRRRVGWLLVAGVVLLNLLYLAMR